MHLSWGLRRIGRLTSVGRGLRTGAAKGGRLAGRTRSPELVALPRSETFIVGKGRVLHAVINGLLSLFFSGVQRPGPRPDVLQGERP